MFVSIVNEFIITLMAAMNHKCCWEADKKKVHAHINRVETILEIKDGVTVIANHLNWKKWLKIVFVCVCVCTHLSVLDNLLLQVKEREKWIDFHLYCSKKVSARGPWWTAGWFQGPAGHELYLTVWGQTWENTSFYSPWPVGQVNILDAAWEL